MTAAAAIPPLAPKRARLDTLPGPVFDTITAAAAPMRGAPIALHREVALETLSGTCRTQEPPRAPD